MKSHSFLLYLVSSFYSLVWGWSASTFIHLKNYPFSKLYNPSHFNLSSWAKPWKQATTRKYSHMVLILWLPDSPQNIILFSPSQLPLILTSKRHISLTAYFKQRFPRCFISLVGWVFLLCLMACRILVPTPGIKPGAPTVKVPSPNHWTAKEFLKGLLSFILSANQKISNIYYRLFS